MTDSNTINWLSLKKAADILGVHPATLRRWADSGDIPVMLTPGGHRRFSSADVERFAADRRQLRSLAPATQVWVQQAMQRTRQDIAGQDSRPWLETMTDEKRDYHRTLGRQLMGLTLQYISGDDEDAELLAEAKVLGQAYGTSSLESGLPLRDALQAAMFFRDTLVETALQLPETTRIRPDANLRLMRRINKLLNVVHLSIAEIYETQN